MESKINVNGVVDTLGDALKLAANLSESAKDYKPNDNSNSAQTNPNQTVQIQMTPAPAKEEEKKPMVIREKPVTHIHKEFPDNRALTDAECNLALEKAKMENDIKRREMEYRQMMDEITRRDRLAKEEQERKDREERRIRNEKRSKRRAIVAGIFGAVIAGLTGYSMYKDYKAMNGSCNFVKGEGDVK